MAIVQANPVDSFVELDIGSSAESFGRFLDSQKELFHSQIDQLQKLVVSQCKLTGVNPLSQEMAAGALSIKIGKKPRDLLNPKAIKYMQSVFSIKDTIGKKETREISALCGVTATQVRDFFAGQRSRVRKLVQLSREKATISDASKVSIDCCPSSSDQTLPISIQAPTNIVDPRTVEGCTLVSGNSGNLNTVQDGQQASVNPADLKTVEEGPSFSSKEEAIPGVDSDDKKFLENIFNLMKKEETFSGQVKLMERILQIHNSAVLNWFLTIGGIMILATWLSQAAVEEQTTVLLVIFKVLCHLPLHKALPVQMSAILQTVNRLRFYRTSDISNRARILLSRWSKLFVRSPALKKPSFTNATKDAQKEIIRKQRISEILSDESWQSKIDIPEEILALTEGTENSRNSEPRHALKLLSASCDESNKKHGRSVSSSKIKERRKVLLVEQPDRKTAGRSMQAARAVPANNSRPLSADDIQKAKMRATFLQDKYGKIDASTGENYQQRTEDGNTSSASQTNTILPASRIPRLSKLKRDEGKKPVIPTTKTSPYKLDSKPKSTSQEPSWEKLKGNQIRWQRPPEMRTNCLWRLGAGENSKEVEVQSERIRREKETFYRSVHDVPSNPKEPWDIEMDFDDSLTPEIPTEQPTDADGAEGSSCSPRDSRDKGVDAAASTSTSTSAPPPVSNGTPEPDLELLAVLLKNPDLVFALTSGQGNSLSSGETVALLDMLKETGIGLTGIIDGLVGSSKPPESTTLPSPTPSDPTTVRLPSPTPQSEPISMRLPSPTPPDPTSTGWRSEPSSLAKNPVLQPHLLGSRGSNIFPAVARSTPSPAIPLAAKNQGPGLRLPHQTPTTILSMPQLTVTVNSSSQHLPVLNFLPKKHTVPLPNQVPVSIHPSQQTLIPELHFPVTNSPTVSSSSLRPETFKQRHIHDPSSFPVLPSLRHLPPTMSRPTSSTHPPTWPPNAANVAKRDLSWNGRPNGLLQVPAPDPRFTASLNNYNGYPRGSGQATLVIPGQTGGRGELLDGSELETWSPQGSPVRSPEFWSGRNFPEQRRENGRNPRPEWSRQRNSGHRDRNRTGGGGKRWRDRDRRR